MDGEDKKIVQGISGCIYTRTLPLHKFKIHNRNIRYSTGVLCTLSQENDIE